jgi:F-type H+-transporting ATPase subunit b
MSQTTIVVAEETTAVEAPAAGETGHMTESTTQEGGHKGAFPPMDASTFPSQIFWLVIFFALLYLLMSKLALPKMAAVLAHRHKTIEGDLAKASALKNETEAAVQAYEKALADARAKAQGIAADTRAKTADAESRIATAKASAMKDVGEVAAETAAEIVSELTGATVSKAEAVKAIASLKA